MDSWEDPPRSSSPFLRACISAAAIRRSGKARSWENSRFSKVTFPISISRAGAGTLGVQGAEAAWSWSYFLLHALTSYHCFAIVPFVLLKEGSYCTSTTGRPIPRCPRCPRILTSTTSITPNVHTRVGRHPVRTRRDRLWPASPGPYVVYYQCCACASLDFKCECVSINTYRRP